MPVSIKDIAQAANVTPGTVSRALRDSPRVHPETKERIQRLAKELGYTPDAQARSLVMGQTQTIGVVVTTLTDPFIGSVVQTIESTAHDHGYAVILASSADIPEREIAAAEMLQSRRVDGVIVTSSRVGALYQERLEQLRVPIVLINSLAGQSGRCIFSIGVDNRHGGYLAANHLIQKGHRRIAYVASPPDRSDSVERSAGYRDALADAGLEFDASLVVQGTGRADGGKSTVPLLLSLDDPPTAVFCYNDMTAVGVIDSAWTAGLSLPQDLAIVGFDDIDFAQFTYPPLTTIAQPIARLGQGAVEMVLALLSDDDAGERAVADTRVRGKLVVRASSG
ncbi:MAG TPA: LacI family DNA-binding transcriptional regulator [Anaerolineae bacterium]|nr:LacI family DNA-binding transcriptional regulator [Anaerolineae bacterium]